MKSLNIEGLCHSFGKKQVLSNINLEVDAGQIVAIVGPSGCGKSTLLRAILGTHPPKKGTIKAGDHFITSPTRDIGIVYQHYSLYDFLTAKENVAFGPMLDRTSIFYRTFCWWKWRAQYKRILEDAEVLLEKVGLKEAVNLYPSEMSGGMRQRCAIAQALIMEPKVLLLDEPFGALDEATREELQLMLLRLYQENLEAKVKGDRPINTILMVTHELTEALYVADRVIGLSQYHGNQEMPGATIVFDKASPVFHPDDPRDFGIFFHLKEELRKVVFNPSRMS